MRLVRLAVGAGLRPDEADDVVQTVWLTLFENEPTVSGPPAAEREDAWLATVARHEVANVYREWARGPGQCPDGLLEEVVDHREEESTVREIRDRQTGLLHCLLEELQRKDPVGYELVYSRYVEGLSVGELARRIGRHAHWISVHLHRALGQLRAWAAQHRQEEEP